MSLSVTRPVSHCCWCLVTSAIHIHHCCYIIHTTTSAIHIHHCCYIIHTTTSAIHIHHCCYNIHTATSAIHIHHCCYNIHTATSAIHIHHCCYNIHTTTSAIHIPTAGNYWYLYQWCSNRTDIILAQSHYTSRVVYHSSQWWLQSHMNEANKPAAVTTAGSCCNNCRQQLLSCQQ